MSDASAHPPHGTPREPDAGEAPPVGGRRARLLARFDAASPAFLSLDVFDTLLWRPFERPTDLFFEVHRALVGSGGHRLGVDASEFARLRAEAELAARAARADGEITIDEIAAALSRALGGAPPAPALVDAELATEARFIELDPDVAALVRHAAARGVPYVLVSDMYLRGEQLRALLAQACARAGATLPPPARVLVSGELRTNKAGASFDRLLAALGCRPDQLLHVGDNPVSDARCPRSKGIPAEHVPRETRAVAAVLDAEAARSAATPAAPEGRRYDAGLRACRLAAALSEASTADAPLDHFQYGALVIGPLLTLFAEWVVDDCVRHGQRRVHCMMREGHLLAPLVRRAAEAAGARLDARPLWVSRYAIRAASFREVSEPELRDYLRKRRAYPLDVVARDLGLSLDALRAATGIRHDSPLSPADADRVVGEILGSEPLGAQLLAASEARRRRLLAYLRREGVLDEPRATLVDLGWGGTIQLRLARALEGATGAPHLRGLYFATEPRVLALPQDACSFDSFLFHLGEPARTWRPVHRAPEVLELSCMPREGSLREFDDDGAPLTFAQVLPARQLDEIAEVQRGVLAFADAWLPGAARRRAHLSHADARGLLDRLRVIAARSVEAPTADEVGLFDGWEHDANDGALDHENLLGDADVRARARFLSYWHIMEHLDSSQTFWPAALARLHGKSAEIASALARSALAYRRVRRGADLFSRAAAVLARKVRK